MSQSNVIEQSIIAFIIGNYMPYTAYVIEERALPEIDGFKPSQRRILYTMYRMGLLKGNRKKSQGIVGQTMFLHPHGDLAIYETLVRMARDSEALTIPFIDSKGNFGKQYSRDMKFASARYTEVRLEEVSKELFRDIDRNAAKMVDNYDNTMKEPKLLPVSFPTILVNPQMGIANTMASNIAPFNMAEVIDFTIAYINSPKTANVADHIIAPDFSTGGRIIKNEAVMKNIFETGRGTIEIRATHEIRDNSIVFTEMPYTATAEAIIDRISALIKEGKIKDIVDINNIYGIKSKGVEVVVKKGVDKHMLAEKLFKMTPLQSTFSCNFNVLINGRPRVMGIKEIIHQWIQFRVECIKNSIMHDIEKKVHKKRMLLALEQVLLDVDKAIKIIKETGKNAEVVDNLMKAFSIDKEQAEYVSEIKLRHLNKEYLIQRIAEIKDIQIQIDDLKDLHQNKRRIAKMLIEQLTEVKSKYAQARKTEVIEVESVSFKEEEVIDDYNVKIMITKEGYLKKMKFTSLKNKDAKIRLKEDDEIISECDTKNTADIVVFTDKQNVYRIRAHEIDDHKTSDFGEYIPAYLSLKDENVLYSSVTDYTEDILIGFEDGKIAKINMSAYNKNRKVLGKAYADKKAIYFRMLQKDEDVDLLAVSSIGKAIVLHTSISTSKTSRAVQGNQFMKSKNESIVTGYYEISEGQDVDYYRAKSAGVGKYLREGDFSDILK